MPSSFASKCAAIAAFVALAAGITGPATAAGPVTVTVNGSQINLNPPPTERAGRVFVPLRGVFENLGATVVYQGGVINATGRGHTVSLRIGSQQATVDGQQQNLDVAPFIIGASTYVPLRFVSQALGATVNYDGSNNLVAINTNGNNAPPPNQVLTPAPNRNGNGGAITLASVVPARGASVQSRRPTIEATFAGGTVDPNSIRVTLDGADVTNNSTRSPRGVTYAPQSPLQAGAHQVVISGNDSNGQLFRRAWQFTSGTSAATVGQITNVRPPSGATVGNQFVVSGRTTPGARVNVTVGVSNGGATTIGAIIGSILGGGSQTNSATYNVTADANGYFSAQVNIGAPSGSTLTLVIHATDPQTGATATPVQETLNVG
jgi:Copper amine oxidase N-terminal domain